MDGDSETKEERVAGMVLIKMPDIFLKGPLEEFRPALETDRVLPETYLEDPWRNGVKAS